jgi:hypothetical protein
MSFVFCFLAAAEIFRDFFNRVFELSLLRNAHKRDKQNRAKQPSQPRKKKKNGQNKSHIFCDELRWIFVKKVLSCF